MNHTLLRLMKSYLGAFESSFKVPNEGGLIQDSLYIHTASYSSYWEKDVYPRRFTRIWM